jgi:hypothetical protein
MLPLRLPASQPKHQRCIFLNHLNLFNLIKIKVQTMATTPHLFFSYFYLKETKKNCHSEKKFYLCRNFAANSANNN